MLEEFKGDLVETVKASADLLSDDEALEIVRICKEAVNRGIAEVTEQYLEESIRNGTPPRSVESESDGEN